MDAKDPLAAKRAEFYLPENTIYLDGNSLGPMTHAAKDRVNAVMTQQWGDDLITSWNKHQWIDLPEIVGEKIAPIIGAGPGQVICCDSVSINLFKVISAALSLNPSRHKVLSQNDNFPTDLYMTQGLENLLGREKCQLVTTKEEDILDSLDESIAVLMLTQVNFRTGRIHDIQSITEKAHQLGILVIWDLAHSAGAIPVKVDEWGVDFAVGCGYKYFNGGPGAPAFVYVAEKHLAALEQPLSGWMGHASPFEFSPDYEKPPSIKQFLCGTPGVVSMSVLDASLDLFTDINIEMIREKSLALTDLFIELVNQEESLNQLEIITPLEHDERGSQIAYCHDDAYAICQALIAEGVIADFRAPNILRFGFSPLFLRYADIEKSVELLIDVVSEKRYDSEQFRSRKAVT
ncbi:kynureninase [Aliikangiella marina]|uniref:Kynureninase n=2 Tax=Aliikangiella marina TaxID=1712262 RepID=A0A545TK52_9GAMM|nr:kynureninase [Aliikangiella marina]